MKKPLSKKSCKRIIKMIKKTHDPASVKHAIFVQSFIEMVSNIERSSL